MLAAIRKRLNRDDEGFTLIELMVVVLIIGILVAIAVPTFLGARGRAQAKQAQSNVRNAFSAEKSAFTDNQAYVAAATVQADEPSLSFLAYATAATNWDSPKKINIELGSAGSPAVANQVVCVYSRGANGTYYGIRDVAVSGLGGSGTTYWKGTDLTTKPACDDQAAAAWAAAW